jgi:hypothetical protein
LDDGFEVGTLASDRLYALDGNGRLDVVHLGRKGILDTLTGTPWSWRWVSDIASYGDLQVVHLWDTDSWRVEVRTVGAGGDERVIGQIGTGYPFTRLHVEGSTAHLTAAGTYGAIDLSDPTRPRVAREAMQSGGWINQEVRANLIYTADPWSGFTVWEVPSAPDSLGNWFTPLRGGCAIPGGAYGFVLDGNRAYVPGDSLYVVDVSESARPRVIRGAPRTGRGQSLVAKAGRFVYVWDLQESRICTFDASIADHPVQIGEYAWGRGPRSPIEDFPVEPDFADRLLAAESLVYILDRWNKDVTVLDATDPAALRAAGWIMSGGDSEITAAALEGVDLGLGLVDGRVVPIRPCTTTPVSLLEFVPAVTQAGVELRWRMSEPCAPGDFQLRATTEVTSWPVEPIEAVGERDFAAVDRANAGSGSERRMYSLFVRSLDGAWGLIADRAWTPAGLARPVELEAAFPSPSKATSQIRVVARQPIRGKVTVCDVRGRLVAELFTGLLQPGLTQMVWDGRDRQRRRAAAGVYFVRLHTDHGIQARRIVYVD